MVEELIELSQKVSRLVLLIKLNVDVSGEPVDLRILVSSTGSGPLREFVLQEVCKASGI